MTAHGSERFQAANFELESFLEKADPASAPCPSIDPAELHRIWLRMVELAPKVSRTARPGGVDRRPPEIQRYMDNLRALRERLESLRGEMLARQAQLGQARTQLERLEGFVLAYQKTV